MAANLTGIDITNFTGGLILLGLGWNFMFIGGTTLVTETYRPEEQGQGAGDQRFPAVDDRFAAASLCRRAAIHAHFGWDGGQYGARGADVR